MHRRTALHATLAALALFALTACDDPLVASAPTCQNRASELQRNGRHDIDLLFVVDASTSMAAKRDRVVAALDEVGAAFEDMGARQRLHVGVVSSDLGAAGVPGCTATGDGAILRATPSGDRFLVHEVFHDFVPENGYPGSLGEALRPLVPEATGCAIEQPLEAMRRVLAGDIPENRGFLRERSHLIVVFVTDEDDCSLVPGANLGPAGADVESWSASRCFAEGVVCDADAPAGEHRNCRPRASGTVAGIAPYVDALLARTRKPTLVTISGGAGPVVIGADGAVAPACTSEGTSAQPGVRLAAFHAAVRDAGPDVSAPSAEEAICSPTFAAAVEPVVVWDNLADQGVSDDNDLDLDTPGLQVDCVVSEIIRPGRDTPEVVETGTFVPRCSSDPPSTAELPCWDLEPSRDSLGRWQSLRVARAHVPAPAGRVFVRLECKQRCDELFTGTNEIR